VIPVHKKLLDGGRCERWATIRYELFCRAIGFKCAVNA
jgi:hypothetical protein